MAKHKKSLTDAAKDAGEQKSPLVAEGHRGGLALLHKVECGPQSYPIYKIW